MTTHTFQPHLQVAGQFTLRKRSVATGEVTQEVGPFSNLITNIGLDRVGTSSNMSSHCYVGTGTVAPAVTDTTMSAFKVTSNTASSIAQVAASSPEWVTVANRTYTFNAGTISGNITEVGIGWAANPLNALWSRELIVDSSGNPIAITVLPTEILEVVYSLRLYIPQTDFTGSFVLNGITYNYTGRARLAGSWRVMQTRSMYGLGIWESYKPPVTLGGMGGTLSGSIVSGFVTRTDVGSYVNNSFTRVGNSSYPLDSSNDPAGLQGFTLGPSANIGFTESFIAALYQVVLDKPIPKTNLNTMSFQWSHTWGRYVPPGP